MNYEDLDKIYMQIDQIRWQLFDARHKPEIEALRDKLADIMEDVEILMEKAQNS